ncbi:MAG: sodium-dependent transporter, partial [Pseudomonadota bacterium]
MLSNNGSDGKRASLHGNWSSKMAFVLAVTGSAVGLGNIWRFPYVAGENGGGAFVLVYLLCVVAIGMPVMMSEILIGRRGRRNPVATMELLGREEGGSRNWRFVGLMGVIGGIFILSWYSVIAGWTLSYIVKSASGLFVGASPGAVVEIHNAFKGNAWQGGIVHTVFMAITIFVVARGVERGLEQAVRFMVPALLVMMLVLLGYSISSGSFGAGVEFLFQPKFEELQWSGVLAAMGQAFFTLSIGMGAIMAYGAYLPEEASINATSATVVAADTAIAILAALVVFPLVFANNLNVEEGPSLVFQTLPLAFGQMPGGAFFSTVFFVLLSFAAWTSAIGLMEPAVAWVMENWNKARTFATLLIGLTIWALGFGSVLSFSVWKDVSFFRGTIFDNLLFVTNDLLLPVGGLLIAVFAGWVMCRNSTAEELGGAGSAYKAWRLGARVVAPVGIFVVLFFA